MLKERAQLLARGLLMVELGVWTLAWAAALSITHAPVVGAYLPALYVTLIAWVAHSFASGLLRSHRTRPIAIEPYRVLVGGGIVVIAASLVLFIGAPAGNPRQFAMWMTLLGVVAVGGLRIALRLGLRRARTQGYNYRRVAIVGSGPLATRIAGTLADNPAWGLQIAGFIADEDIPGPRLGSVADIERILDQTAIDEVIVAVEQPDLDALQPLFLRCEERGVATRVVLSFFPQQTAHLSLDDLDGLPLLAFQTARQGELDLLIKRAFDVAVAVAALIACAPVLLGVALAIRVADGGPVLFVQRRVGQNGREFDLYKFRSMVVGAEARRGEIEHRNEMSGPVFKVRDDPRITRLGRLLRRMSLDELPQFWNVLLGEMSVVGPRPALLTEVARYERWQRRRLSVKPGITGVWQVSGRNDVDFEEWMRLDLRYIDEWSLGLDVAIVLRTIPAVLLGRGSR